ncbi:hypothetical protein BDW59DRAFT_117374 [Aspergillus cavernicola]|uniref:Bactericidal permeability-increasing protein n=1 Tax=Aspergillus cavernicola TaxID=176166 RepID=A0ABR4HXG7_9EURO
MPSRSAVNVPTNTRIKEKDINQKLQLFGIFHAFKNGKLPSNKQCDVALNTALNHRALTKPSAELSEEGRVLVEDLRKVIEESRKLILSKNHGQLLQEFIYDAERISADDVQKPGVSLGRESDEQDAAKAKEGLKSLGNLLLTNGEFRKLLNDAMTIARDIAGDASQKAANRVRPSEEQLDQVDQPAEDNVWHEKPDVSGYRDQFKNRFSKNKAQQEASGVANTGVQAATGGQQPSSTSDVDLQSGVNAAVQHAKSKVPEDQKQEALTRSQEYRAKTIDYLSEKLPKERRDQHIWRMKKMIIEIQGHRDYQQAIETLLNMAEKYGSRSREMAQQGSGSFQGTREQGPVQRMEKSLRTLIERFANSTSMGDFFESLETIYRDADKDPELKGWFKNINNFIRKSLQQQGYIMQDDWNRQYDELTDHGQFLLRSRYRNHTDHILDEAKFLGDQFNRDPQNKAFGDSMQKLFTDLGRDEYGNPKFKPHLLKDLRDVIVPAIFENVRYVPIPRIEVSDPMADVVIENLVVESDNLMPNVVEFGSDNYFRWGRKKISSKKDNKIMISVSGIQADLRDVSYYINKKQGFPSITDTGVMDIFLGGEGFSFKIAASTAQKKDRQNFVKLDKVSVKIDDIDIKLKKSNHKVLFSVFKPLLFRTVRPVLQKVLEQQIRDAFTKCDAFAYDVHTEAKRVKEHVKENPEDAPNVYSRYMNAVRAKMEEGKRQAQQVAQRDTKVQTTTTLKGSLFPDIKLPGGITTKATEYEEIARKGERWESPIFSIGSANESTDIPKPDDITRKPHTTAESKLRDRSTGGGAADGIAAGSQGQYTNGGALGAGRVTTGSRADPTFGAQKLGDTTLTNGSTTATNGHSKLFDPLSSNGGTYKSNANGKYAQDISTIAGTHTAFNPQTA